MATKNAPSLGRHPWARFLLRDLPAGVGVEHVNIVSSDGVVSTGLLYTPRSGPSKTVIYLQHPRTDQSQHYTVPTLVNAGYSVLGHANRWVQNDVVTEHELLLFDYAAGVTFLRERGFHSVVGLGNSGGGPLAAFYQSQAELAPSARVAHRAGGQPTGLAALEMPQLDGLVLLAAHSGQGDFLLKCLDPSVVIEGDRLSTDSRLDMYDERNGFQPGSDKTQYDDEFIAAYRSAQIARSRRLDAIARSYLDQHTDAALLLAGAETELTPAQRARELRRRTQGDYMVVYRTGADLVFADLTIEPDDRVVSSLFSQDPHVDNYAEHGFGHYMSPAAWLSTWSGTSSRASMRESLPNVSIPTVVLHYAGDTATRLSEAQGFHDLLGSSDKELRIENHANHYGMRIVDGTWTSERTQQNLSYISSWLGERFSAPARRGDA